MAPPKAEACSQKITCIKEVAYRFFFLDLLQFLLLMMFFVWVGWRGVDAMEYRWQWYRVPNFFFKTIDSEIIWGALDLWTPNHALCVCMGMLLALLIGFVTAFLRLSNSLSGRGVASVYLELIRNTPLLVQVSIFYFVLQPILGINNPLWTGILCLAFFEGSFASEIMRGDSFG